VRRQTADLLLLTTMCLWALNFSASKYVITHGLTPLAYGAPRYALAAAIFVVLTLLLERSLRVGRRDAALLAGAAAILCVNQVGFIYALHFATATTVALVFGTLPIFTGAIGALTGVEHPTRRFVLAAMLSFAGVALVALGSGGELSANLKGDALALVAAATWAAYTVLIAPLMARHTPYRISAYVLTLTALLLAVVGSRQIAAQDYTLSAKVWATFAFAVLGPLVVTNVLWFTAIDVVGPSHASLVANLQFFVAAIFGVLLLSESITLVQVAGGGAIAAAILLSRFERAPARRRAE
jgi:drug/metabolite transporter (DMT)-like permease